MSIGNDFFPGYISIENDFNGYDFVFSVKPAVFDLFLTFAIIGYLVSVYFAIILFPDLYSAICKLSNSNKAKVN